MFLLGFGYMEFEYLWEIRVELFGRKYFWISNINFVVINIKFVVKIERVNEIYLISNIRSLVSSRQYCEK